MCHKDNHTNDTLYLLAILQNYYEYLLFTQVL